MKKLIFILLAFVSIAAYGQKKQTIKELVVTDTMTIKAGNPATNKIPVSVDGNGKIRWQYLSDFQDSINTGVYDTIEANLVITESIRIDSAAIANDTIMSIGTSGTVTKCPIGCDDLQDMRDSILNTQWVSNGAGGTVLRTIGDSVGIGTDDPQAKLHVDGTFLQNNGLFTIGSDFNRFGFTDAVGITGVSGVNDTTLLGWSDDGLGIGAFKIKTKNGNLFSEFNSSSGVIGFNVTDGTDILSISMSPSLMQIVDGEFLASGGATVELALTIDIPSKGANKILTSDAGGNATWTDPDATPSARQPNSVTPVNGGSDTIPDNTEIFVLTPAGLLATYTLVLPANPVTNQLLYIVSSGFGITALTLNVNTGQSLVGSLTTLAANVNALYFFDGSVWIKL